VGSAKDLKDLTGAPIAMHAGDKQALENGRAEMPPAVTPWGHVLGGFLRMLMPLVKVPATEVDIVVEEEFDLDPIGVPGKILHTPGHSRGSLSLVLDTGDAFVGDLAMNGFPLRTGRAPQELEPALGTRGSDDSPGTRPILLCGRDTQDSIANRFPQLSEEQSWVPRITL